MIIVAGRKSFTVGVVPSCAAYKILVSVRTKGIAIADFKGDTLRNIEIKGNGFIRVVVAIRGDIKDRGFKVGDTVASVTNGDQFDALDGGDQDMSDPMPIGIALMLGLESTEYLNVQPGCTHQKLWQISAAEANELGFMSPLATSGNGCTIV
ncbi:hypothetical protein FRB94_014265 [Tulasnella sp. JGI-2019a]|nr:hypothetical protein FRB93_005383 [Tulasnella sp. JGI-2019a]KAG9014172.1 hypothetical protein FRB94_014265 [Tulasnella sp. JGI-2019a]